MSMKHETELLPALTEDEKLTQALIWLAYEAYKGKEIAHWLYHRLSEVEP